MITLLGSYVRDRHETVWSGGLVALLEQLGFSSGAARAALTRLARRDLIKRVRRGRLIYYCITQRAIRLLAEGDGRIFSLGRPTDPGTEWTVLWHQIPEDRRLERSRLGRRLRFFGFGLVQDSLWVLPHDREAEVIDLLHELEVADCATVMRTIVATAHGLEGLASRAWDLDGLADRYARFADEFSRYSRDDELSDEQAFLVRTRLVHQFRGFPFLDPELLDESPVLSGARCRAVAVFHSLYEVLDEPSQRYFDRVTRQELSGAVAAS